MAKKGLKPKPKVHILVCRNARPPGHEKGCCVERGGTETLETLEQLRVDSEMFRKVKVSKTDCLGKCSLGPVVIVYPDNVWYGQVDPEKAKKIWESHVNEGKPLKELEIPEGSD